MESSEFIGIALITSIIIVAIIAVFIFNLFYLPITIAIIILSSYYWRKRKERLEREKVETRRIISRLFRRLAKEEED